MSMWLCHFRDHLFCRYGDCYRVATANESRGHCVVGEVFAPLCLDGGRCLSGSFEDLCVFD